MANSPDVDGRYFLPATAPISGGVEKSTVVDRHHGGDIRPPVAQRAPSGLERPHMHANFINRGPEREPGRGLFLHSEQTRRKSGCNNAAAAAFG